MWNRFIEEPYLSDNIIEFPGKKSADLTDGTFIPADSTEDAFGMATELGIGDFIMIGEDSSGYLKCITNFKEVPQITHFLNLAHHELYNR